MTDRDQLLELAHLYGVQTAYWSVGGEHVEASAESLLAVLETLAGPFDGPAEVAEALEARRRELAERLVEPVLVAWDGRLDAVDLSLPADVQGAVACHLDLEGGERRAWQFDVAQLGDGAPTAVGTPRRRLALPEPLPMGYHRLRIGVAGRSAAAQVLAAPVRVYGGDPAPLWGVFLPLHALRTANSWGAGDLSDLEALAEWTASLGGGVVGTLPLLAAFLDEPCEVSPYAPASRLFWNELYVDPRALPGAEVPAVRRLLASDEVRREAAALAALPRVDYPRLQILKRRVLEELVQQFYAEAGPEHEELLRFVAERPELERYAAFRAVLDRRGEPWQLWPERLRDGALAPADYDEEDYRYHLWAQWAAERQMRDMARKARQRGPGLYLDLPLGVHASSFDVWRQRDLFAVGTSAGAPPDAFFTKGQSWGFPPLVPERLRERGYDHLIACLRHHLQHAGLLRIDHVMQLHRLFWIPAGMEAAQGVYVRYPADELYAVLAIESHRHRTIVVGENLGTVPPEVGEAIDRHGVLGMYVLQYEVAPGGGGLLREPPASSIASLNTHDMPTFRGFWEGRDVDDLAELGFFDAQQARQERQRRAVLRDAMLAVLPDDVRPAADAACATVARERLEHLAASPARIVLVNLEDLWGEGEPQNVPGTHDERPNWRRKARYSLEELARRPEVTETLRRIDELRKAKGEA
ncbi:MAG TPA: 4-alpha-glucanotransferase [Thermoanaerobaculia bacterium]